MRPREVGYNIYLVLSLKSGEAGICSPYHKKREGFPTLPFLIILDPAHVLL